MEARSQAQFKPRALPSVHEATTRGKALLRVQRALPPSHALLGQDVEAGQRPNQEMQRVLAGPKPDGGTHARMHHMPQVPDPDLFLRSAMVQSRSQKKNMYRLPVRPMERKEEGTVAMHQMQIHVRHRPVPLVDDGEEHHHCETLQMQQLLVEREGVGEGRGSIELSACNEEYEAGSQEVEHAASGRPP